MIFKSLVAGTVMSLMAGGVVYFGSEVDASTMKDNFTEKTAELKADLTDKIKGASENVSETEHPHDKKSKTRSDDSSADISSVKTPSGTTIKAKEPTVSHSSGSKDKKDASKKEMMKKDMAKKDMAKKDMAKKDMSETASSAKADKPKKAETTADTDKSEKKWLDQYLKSEKAEKENTRTTMAPKTAPKATMADKSKKTEAMAKPEKEASVARDLMKSMGLTDEGAAGSDTGSFMVKDGRISLTDEQIEAAEAAGFEKRAMDIENIWVEGGDGESKKVEVRVIENDDSKTMIETETIDMGNGKTMKFVTKTVKTGKDMAQDGKKMRIKVMTDKDGKGGMSAEKIKGVVVLKMDDEAAMAEMLKATNAKDISKTVKVVMTQAKLIKMPELRDRAYLDLVSYGLDHGDYNVAKTALKEIGQEELRDTARNRIAIAYAQDGKSKKAFAILDDIEVDALRDVMRLQVIEAMIVPEEFLEEMQ
ncbi:hypothetical protein N9W89_13680 [Hellea sp.]|nr:hypothetical protein [Hellea sp.]